MSQADELEALCHLLDKHVDVAEMNFNTRALPRLEAIAENGGFLSADTIEVGKLWYAADRLRLMANRIEGIRRKLVAKCPA